MQKHSNTTPKVALITGAARRIGAEIARILHRSSINIVLHFHASGEEAKALCAELNAERANSAVALPADLLNVLEMNELVHKAAEAWGGLDILVNNASRFHKTHVGLVTEEIWDDLLNSNLKAPFFMAQAAAPHLKKNQGCIVNIADIHGETPMRDYAVYCMSKAGLIMQTKALAKELSPEIRVNAVSPGAIAWPEGENNLTNALKQKIIQRTALGRHGSPHDIAKAVLYLVRDADYVTGQIIEVDGGRGLSI